MSLWQDLADEYTAAHPNVTIDIQVLENEAFKTKLDHAAPAGRRRPTCSSRGAAAASPAGRGRPRQGHHRRHRATWKRQINAGRARHVPGRRQAYGMPFDLGLVGFWYNTKTFAEAGITTPPATWDELLTDVQTLKDKGITPIALAGKDTWTGLFYWAYLAVRDVRAGRDGQGRHDRRLVRPVLRQGRRGLQAAHRHSSRSRKASSPHRGTAPAARPRPMATYNGAIQLMGQWLPGTVQRQLRRQHAPWARASAGSRSRPSTGGAGDAFDGLGGGNGFAVGKDAPPETVDFLKFLVSLDAANRWGALNSGILPTTNGSEASIDRPDACRPCSRAGPRPSSSSSTSTRRPRLSWVAAINEAVATLYAGTGTPESVVEAIQAAAKQ